MNEIKIIYDLPKLHQVKDLEEGIRAFHQRYPEVVASADYEEVVRKSIENVENDPTWGSLSDFTETTEKSQITLNYWINPAVKSGEVERWVLRLFSLHLSWLYADELVQPSSSYRDSMKFHLDRVASYEVITDAAYQLWQQHRDSNRRIQCLAAHSEWSAFQLRPPVSFDPSGGFISQIRASHSAHPNSEPTPGVPLTREMVDRVGPNWNTKEEVESPLGQVEHHATRIGELEGEWKPTHRNKDTDEEIKKIGQTNSAIEYEYRPKRPQFMWDGLFARTFEPIQEEATGDQHASG